MYSKLSGGIADKKGMKHNRRKTQRNLCAALVMISWTEDGGGTRTEIVALVDISATGACVHLEHPLPVEATVSLHHLQGKYEGRVRYCRPQKIGYSLGIAFEPGYRWTRLDFQPINLILGHAHVFLPSLRQYRHNVIRSRGPRPVRQPVAPLRS